MLVIRNPVKRLSLFLEIDLTLLIYLSIQFNQLTLKMVVAIICSTHDNVVQIYSKNQTKIKLKHFDLVKHAIVEHAVWMLSEYSK